MKDNNIVEWSNRYSVGIDLVDDQHKKLIDMTNTLYLGCLHGDEAARSFFLETIHKAVDYVKYHFSTEEKIMERIDYPGFATHKTEHHDFVREIIQEVRQFQDGKSFVPNMFVRYLRDWVFTHMALSDKGYADYLIELKKQGKLYRFTIKPKDNVNK
jgi:hemerythrin